MADKQAKLGLWDRIRAKRERGEKPAQPGDKDYPDSKNWKRVTSISRKKQAGTDKACSCGCGDTVKTCKCGSDCSCRKPGGSCYKAEKQAGSPAWQRSEGKNEEGGLNAKGRASYNKATGGNLKAPVTESNPKGERAKRQNSFCSRMCGMKRKNTGSDAKKDPDSRINKSLRKWNCKCSSAREFGEKAAKTFSPSPLITAGLGSLAGSALGGFYAPEGELLKYILGGAVGGGAMGLTAGTGRSLGAHAADAIIENQGLTGASEGAARIGLPMAGLIGGGALSLPVWNRINAELAHKPKKNKDDEEKKMAAFEFGQKLAGLMLPGAENTGPLAAPPTGPNFNAFDHLLTPLPPKPAPKPAPKPVVDLAAASTDFTPLFPVGGSAIGDSGRYTANTNPLAAPPLYPGLKGKPLTRAETTRARQNDPVLNAGAKADRTSGGTSAPAPAPASEPAPAPAPATTPPPAPAQTDSGSNWPLIAAGGGLSAAALLALYYAMKERDKPKKRREDDE